MYEQRTYLTPAEKHMLVKVGWFIGWFDGWLVGFLDGSLTNWLVGWFVGWLIDGLMDDCLLDDRLIVWWLIGWYIIDWLSLFQVMGFGLFLLDSENTSISINKLDQKKRLRLEKLDRVCNMYNVYCILFNISSSTRFHKNVFGFHFY